MKNGTLIKKGGDMNKLRNFLIGNWFRLVVIVFLIMFSYQLQGIENAVWNTGP